MKSLICHSSESMPELDDESVALTVTSPPYWNAIDYDRHAKDDRLNYRTRKYSKGFLGYDEYLSLLDRVFAEVLRVTKPGGFAAVVIGTVLMDARPIAVPFEFTMRMQKLGWKFHQDIIWHKCTAGIKRAGVTIQKPFPGYYYPNIMTEYILVFHKPGERISKGRPKSEMDAARYPINALFTKDIANNVWHIAPVPPGHLDHPCPFPEEIPYRLITLYSFPDDLVLDPFLGAGQTTKVATALGRRAAGYDIEERYVKYATKRLKEPLAVRPMQLIAEFAKIDLLQPARLNGSAPSNGVPVRTRRQRRSSEAALFGNAE
jgi:site-specific DNA-methyltransferase (adenine-specific)